MARSIFTVLGLLSLVWSSLCDQDVLSPRVDRLTPPQPFNRALILGLLGRAASSCSGCPIGGVCCSGGETCCGVAQRCCSDGGCCQLTFYCDSVDGVKGCCPVGRVCTGTPSTGTATTTRATTRTSTTSATLTGVPTTITTASSTTATSTQTPLTSLPTPTAGSQNVVVDVSGLSLSGDWETTTASCNSSATSKIVASDGSTAADYSTITYSFTGTAIYLKSSSINAHYVVVLDADAADYGGISSFSLASPPNCTYGWWRDGLVSKLHTVIISVYGGNSTLMSGRRATQPWAFEFQHFV
ncbi:hypothetical protein C8R43DRAFT_1044780 [Mycena crocata]|nr:hypothetical protein C8R43DRAFT_1044780 [Mycena crocata]